MNPFVALVSRVVAAVAVVACCLVGATTPSHAASVAGTDTAPTDVFLGTVVKHHPEPRVAGSSGREWTYTVSVTTVFVGTVSTRRVTVTTPAYVKRCPTTPLAKNAAYVFRLELVSTGLVAGACRQITPSDTATIARLKRAHPGYHDPVPAPQAQPPAPPPVITALPAAAPASFTKLALPGFGLVVVGLLGLLVARRMARPRWG